MAKVRNSDIVKLSDVGFDVDRFERDVECLVKVSKISHNLFSSKEERKEFIRNYFSDILILYLFEGRVSVYNDEKLNKK